LDGWVIKRAKMRTKNVKPVPHLETFRAILRGLNYLLLKLV
jgi:hypothetical protein